MNTLGYFAREEKSNMARSDAREGAAWWLQPQNAELAIEAEGVFHRISDICGPIRRTKAADLRINVFCMFAICSTHLLADTLHIVDERNLSFGDTFAVVKDGDELLRRVRAAADSLPHTLHYGLVQYIHESSYEGTVGAFRKSSAYEYQSEFRIALTPGTGGPYEFEVGDLSDLLIVGPLSDINRRIIRLNRVGI